MPIILNVIAKALKALIETFPEPVPPYIILISKLQCGLNSYPIPPMIPNPSPVLRPAPEVESRGNSRHPAVPIPAFIYKVGEVVLK